MPILGSLAYLLNTKVPFLSGTPPEFGKIGLYLISLGTTALVIRLSDQEEKPRTPERILLWFMLLAPFIFLTLRSGFVEAGRAIYQTLPHLAIATAFGLLPSMISAARRRSQKAGNPEGNQQQRRPDR
jgi:hypothetical protein